MVRKDILSLLTNILYHIWMTLYIFKLTKDTTRFNKIQIKNLTVPILGGRACHRTTDEQ